MKRGCPRGVIAKALDYEIVVREFEFQPHYYVHVRTNIFRERYETPCPSGFGIK